MSRPATGIKPGLCLLPVSELERGWVMVSEKVSAMDYFQEYS
jgi:hypothetical protein